MSFAGPSFRAPLVLLLLASTGAAVGSVSCAGCSKWSAQREPVPVENRHPPAAEAPPTPSPALTAEPHPTLPANVTLRAALVNGGVNEGSKPLAPKPGGASDRIYSRARFAWIQPEPRASRGWLGYLGLGGSVAVRGGSLAKAHVAGSGGCAAWYAIEPVGYVCAGDGASVDPADPVVVALAADAPRTDSPWPYEYGESLGAPRYVRAPTEKKQHHDEWDLDEHLELIAAARSGKTVDKLAGVDLSPAAPGRWGALPDPASLPELSPLVRESRPRIASGSTVAYTRSFELGGRTFVITHDHALVPKDRIKPYPRSEFHGVVLGADVALPLAFFREHERPRYHRGPDGVFATTGEPWPRLAFVALTGEAVKDGKRTFLATNEPETWVLESDAAVVRAIESPPAQVKAMKSGRKTWLDISVLGGTLVAYEDDRPVFATLISPGRGGIPEDGRDPLETASTPTGTFRVDGKFVTATMVFLDQRSARAHRGAVRAKLPRPARAARGLLARRLGREEERRLRQPGAPRRATALRLDRAQGAGRLVRDAVGAGDGAGDGGGGSSVRSVRVVADPTRRRDRRLRSAARA